MVAEHIPDDEVDAHLVMLAANLPGCEQPQREVVAYALGKVENSLTAEQTEQRRLDDQFKRKFLGGTNKLYNLPQLRSPPITDGHVTSIAVMDNFQRLGLGNKLMLQLHNNMLLNYNAGTCGLHVRKSNEAALKLYKRGEMGYEIEEVISQYYVDGEDAYFMRKKLSRDQDLKVEGEVRVEEASRKQEKGGSSWGRGLLV